MRRRNRAERVEIPEDVLSADGERCSELWQDWCEVTGYNPLDFIVEHIRRQLPDPRTVQ